MAVAKIDEEDLHIMPRKYRSALRLGTFLITSVTLLFCLFEVDFGDKEHVFSPLRRWYKQQKDAFWTLTPEEQKRVSLYKEAAVQQNSSENRT